MYGKKSYSVDEARLDLFMKAYKPKGKKPMGQLKGIDGSSLPPCRAVLIQQIRRAHYLCSAWNNATIFTHQDLSPENYGWELEMQHNQQRLRPLWFEGDMCPSELNAKLASSKITENLDEEEEFEYESDEGGGDVSDEECEDDF